MEGAFSISYSSDVQQPLARLRLHGHHERRAAGYGSRIRGYVFDVRTGRRLIEFRTSATRCIHDQEATLLCQNSFYFDNPLTAYDTSTGKKLWQLPVAERVAPRMTTAYRGLVYGSTSNGPVILDARAGKDKVTTLSVAPIRVITGFGFAVRERERNSLFAYPATG
ncbi:hypothetical protein [Nonomuraea sp. B1E8]|uniref:hypothetical protein n=1 Tax=unclassified Nonomuraea TaxID=2593643 RepID=UPI00325DA2F1